MKVEKVAASLNDAKKRVARWREEGKTIALTNGCFDILHVGHVRSLQEARSKAHRLIVAVNSDESVARLKGRGRPIIPGGERAEVLAALCAVDLVVLFNEDTACEVVRALKPDVYAKAGDYDMAQIPEAGIVREYGGELCTLRFHRGLSTSRVLEALRREDE